MHPSAHGQQVDGRDLWDGLFCYFFVCHDLSAISSRFACVRHFLHVTRSLAESDYPERHVCQEQPVRDAHQWVFKQERLVQVQHRVRQMAFQLFVFQTGNSVFLAWAHLTVVITEKKVADCLLCLVGVPVSPAFTVHSPCSNALIPMLDSVLRERCHLFRKEWCNMLLTSCISHWVPSSLYLILILYIRPNENVRCFGNLQKCPLVTLKSCCL